MRNFNITAPNNYEELLTAKIGCFVEERITEGKYKGMPKGYYSIIPMPIKDVCANPVYAQHKLRDKFNAIAKLYKKGDIERAKAEYVRLVTRHECFNVRHQWDTFPAKDMEHYAEEVLNSVGSNTVAVSKSEYAPYNYSWYKEAAVYALKLIEGEIGYDPTSTETRIAVVGYKVERLKNKTDDDGTVHTAIEQLCNCKTYDAFRLNGYNIHQVFDIIETEYKQGDVKKAQRLYIKAIKAIREYNASITEELNNSIDFRLNRSKWLEINEERAVAKSKRIRWDALMSEILPQKDPDEFKEKLKTLNPAWRELWLMRAADYGLTVPTTELERKDVYTMRIASVAEDADMIHPFNKYHPTTTDDPIKTFVGRHTQTVTHSSDENEALLCAHWFARHGDEFIEKCRPLYDIVYKSHYVTATDILYTGTAAQCEAELEHYKEMYEDEDGYCIVVPSAKEITIREARLLGVTEYDSYGEDGKLRVRDFNYDAEDILD
jgi:tetratricopeptide (TPR) repeat protein